MEWGAAITAIVTLLLAVAKWYAANQPKRDQDQRDEEIQQGRTDIANGYADAVAGRIDRLFTRQPLSAGQQSNPITAERISTILGVADSRRSPSPDTGASGSVPESKGD